MTDPHHVRVVGHAASDAEVGREGDSRLSLVARHVITAKAVPVVKALIFIEANSLSFCSLQLLVQGHNEV